MFAPRLVVFDLDGTLLDTGPDIAASCNYALAQFGRQPLRTEVILRYVGDGSRRLMARAAGLTERDQELDPLVETYLAHYTNHSAVRTDWMPHALQVLDDLRDIPVALCTNKPRAITIPLLEHFHMLDRFATVVAAGDTKRGKPSPDPLLHLGAALQIEPRDMIMVGDSAQDVLAGRAVGARTIGVLGGYGAEQSLRAAKPDVVVADMSQVPKIVARWREPTVRTRASH